MHSTLNHSRMFVFEASTDGTVEESSQKEDKPIACQCSTPNFKLKSSTEESDSTQWSSLLLIFLLALMTALSILGIALYTRHRINLKRIRVRELRRKKKTANLATGEGSNGSGPEPSQTAQFQTLEEASPSHDDGHPLTEVMTNKASRFEAATNSDSPPVECASENVSQEHPHPGCKENVDQVILGRKAHNPPANPLVQAFH